MSQTQIINAITEVRIVDDAAVVTVIHQTFDVDLVGPGAALALVAAARAEEAEAGAAASATFLTTKISDVEDADYIAQFVDGSEAQNVLFRVKRATGQLEFTPYDELADAIDNAASGLNAIQPSGESFKKRKKPVADPTQATLATSVAASPGLIRKWSYQITPALFVAHGGIVTTASSWHRIKSVSVASGGNFGTFNQNAVRLAFMTDAPLLNIAVPGSSTKFRILVDGLYLNLAGTSFASTSGGTHIVLTLDGDDHRIDYEFEQNAGFEFASAAGATLLTAPGDRVWAVDTTNRVRFGVVGDSYSTGTGATLQHNAWNIIMAQRLVGNDADVWQIALGGTGYVNAGGSNTFGSASRIADLAASNPDVVVFAGGVNDGAFSTASIQAAAFAAFQAARAALPNAPIIVLGPWVNVSTPIATLQGVENAIKAAVFQSADPRIWFIPVLTASVPWLSGTGKVGSPNGTGNTDWAISADGVHPTDNGHAWLGVKAANAIRDLIPLF